MERITTAPAGIDQRDLDVIEQEARKRALEKAAESGARVDEVATFEKEEVRALLGEQKQGAEADPDTAGVTQPPEATEAVAPQPPEAQPQGQPQPQAQGETLSAEHAEAELVRRAKEANGERLAEITATPDAVVVKPDGDMLAQQDDATRQVGITARGLNGDAVKSGLTKRAAKHEADHVKQEIGDQRMELPKTGNPTIDRNTKGFHRLIFREELSIDAEGGLNGHPPEYQDFVRYSDAVRSELNAAGKNGEAMVRDAGYTVKGFQEVHRELARVAIEKQIKQGKLSAAAEAAKEAEAQYALVA